MTTVYLALGSNVGDSARHIKLAVTLLEDVLNNVRQAPVYLSRAVGYTDQPNFLNTAVSGQTDLEPEVLLEKLKNIEKKVGRTATFHHGPRQIDIDIILYGHRVIKNDRLIIPHPRFKERDFVLKPLCDLDPNLKDPVSGRMITQLLGQLKPEQKAIIT